MDRFKTLLLREWLQHRRGWLVLMALRPCWCCWRCCLGHGTSSSTTRGRRRWPSAGGGLALITIGRRRRAVLRAGLGRGPAAGPGLARRDQQDRSIEFWLSLPDRPCAGAGRAAAGAPAAVSAGRAGVGGLAGLADRRCCRWPASAWATGSRALGHAAGAGGALVAARRWACAGHAVAVAADPADDGGVGLAQALGPARPGGGAGLAGRGARQAATATPSSPTWASAC
jgi:hypothetical protein